MKVNRITVIKEELKDTPLQEYSMFIYHLCELLEISPYMLIAIMEYETNHFKNKLFTDYNSVFHYHDNYNNIINSIHDLAQDVKYAPDRLIKTFGSRENVINHKIYGEYYKNYKVFIDKMESREQELDKYYTFTD